MGDESKHKSIKSNYKSFEINSNYVFCYNSLKTQVPYQVLDEQYRYITEYNVQPYGSNDISIKLQLQLQQVNRFIDTFFNNKKGKIIFETSNLNIYTKIINNDKSILERGEILISNRLHIGQDILPKDKYSVWNFSSRTDVLLNKLSANTKYVILNHVCDITGEILDIENLVRKIRRRASDIKIIVDGSLYMPHHILKVDKWDVDMYIVSFKSFLLPNLWAAYISDGESDISGDNNYYEQIGLLGLETYMQSISKVQTKTRGNLQVAYNKIYYIENELIRLFQKLSNRFTSVFKIIHSSDHTNRGKVSNFTIKFHNYRQDDVILFLNELNIFCENDEQGIKFSFIHYNTCQEVEYIFNILEEYNVKQVSNWNLSNLFISRPTVVVDEHSFIGYEFKDYFEFLSKDPYIQENVFRLYSIMYLPTELIVGNNRLLKNNLLQHHQKVNIIETKILRTLLAKFKEFVRKRIKHFSYVMLHQIRYNTRAKNIGRLLQEEINVNCSFIGILIVKRNNISGVLEVKKNEQVERVSFFDQQLLLVEMRDTVNIITNVEAINEGTSILDVVVLKTIF
jgi:selenocysteine lyase/cysteine desulfurase